MNFKNILTLFFNLILLYTLYKSIIYSLNTSLIFQPRTTFEKFDKFKTESFFKNIHQFDCNIDDFYIRSGLEYINCILLKHKNSINKNDILFIYCHGTAGNITQGIYCSELPLVLQYGDVLLFDYQGYGRSGGFPHEHNMYNDIKSIWRYSTKILKYKPENIILFGNSLGCAIITKHINKLFYNNKTLPRGIILQSPFYSLEELIKSYNKKLNNLCIFDFNNSKNLELLTNKIPIVVIHSKDDKLINIKQSQKLCNEIDAELCEAEGSHSFVEYNPSINEKIEQKFNILKLLLNI